MTAILVLGAGPAMLGPLAALAQGPALIVGLAGGGVVDRNRRRPLLILADLIRAGVLITVPIAAWLHLLALPHIFIAAALVGACSALFDMANHAYLPGLIGTDRLLDGNSKTAATESVAELGGPALAGFLFQWLSAPVAIAVNAVSYLASAAVIFTIDKPEPRPEPPPAEHWLSDVTSGFRTALAEPRIRPLLFMTIVNGLFGGIFSALYLVFALKTLHLSPALLGLTIACGGIGAFAGASLAEPLAKRLGVGPAILTAGFTTALAVALIPMAPANPVGGMAVLIASQLLGDSSGVVSYVLISSFRQTVLPQEMLGRVGGAFQATLGGMIIVGALAGGAIGAAFGVREGLMVAASGFVLIPLIGLASPLRHAREMA